LMTKGMGQTSDKRVGTAPFQAMLEPAIGG
jgi:hypothetical protein